MYDNWKKQQLEQYQKDLYDIGYVPAAVETSIEMLEQLMDTAYHFGVAYNAKED